MFKALLKHRFFILEILPDYVQCFPVAERLINTFVFTRIDYCNALLAGASKATLHK